MMTHIENNTLCYTLNDLCIIQGRENQNRMDKRKLVDEDEDDDDDKFKSKNLNAERRRRKKLSDRQLQLRSLVPIITNMNKATIICDAITYIEELKKSVEELSNQLLQMENTNYVDEDKIKSETIDEEHETKKMGIITPEVEVSSIPGMKVWIKAVFQKKRGAITKLMEAITALGFSLNDTSVTTSGGAVLFTSSGEGIHGGIADADQIKKYLLEIVRSRPKQGTHLFQPNLWAPRQQSSLLKQVWGPGENSLISTLDIQRCIWDAIN